MLASSTIYLLNQQGSLCIIFNVTIFASLIILIFKASSASLAVLTENIERLQSSVCPEY